MKPLLRILGITLLALMVLGGGLVAWVLRTESGARSALAVARNWLPPGLTIDEVRGTIMGTLRLRNFHYRDERVGMDLVIDSAELEASPFALLGRRLRVNRVRVQGARLELFPATVAAPPSPDTRDPWVAPLDMLVGELQLTRAELRRAGAAPLLIQRLALRDASWIRDNVVADRLEVAGPDGEVALAVRIGSRAPKLERLQGTFRWRAEEHEWNGTLQVSGGRDQLELNVALEQPVKVQASASLQLRRRNDAPETWRARLDVPAFDPHPLLQTQAFHTTGLALEGSGDMHSGSLNGVLTLDEHRVHIERLEVARHDQLLQLNALRLRLDDQLAALRGKATIALDGSAPASAQLQWDEFELPDAWMGPRFRCAGQLAATATQRRFALNGNVRLARAQRASTLTLRVDGSKDGLHIQEFELTQVSGALSVSGNIDFAQPVSWQLDAEARDFDPSLFADSWPGALSFQLHSTGRWPQAGPQARFQLVKLSGRLRNRTIQGAGDVTLGADRRPSGTLQLQSGGAALSVAASSGAQPRVDATLKIAALQEWRSELGGAIDLQASARGRWPDVEIDARLSGTNLRSGASRIEALKAQLAAHNGRVPRGRFDLQATNLQLGGMKFDDLATRLEGDAGAHTFSLAANGKVLSVGVHAAGALQRSAWSGTVDKLGISVARVPPLALTQPAHLAIARDDFELGSTCLSGGDISLCASVRRQRGELAANYTIRALPLGVLLAVAAPGGSGTVEGLLEGNGELHRNINGVLSGRAALTSSGGALAQGPGKDALRIEYRDVGVDLDITPAAATARLRGELVKQGHLGGTLSLAMGHDDPALSGDASLSLRDLSPLGWWLPQLANLRGSGELAAKLGGTVAQPRVAFTVRGTGLDAEVPLLGIHLQDGNLDANLEPGGAFTADGSLTSGDGQARLSGSRNATQSLELRISGNNFLAANVPGARVVIAPELALGGKIGDLALTGKVTIENADVDLEKLSISRSYRASSDVVVIDREQKIESRAAGLATDVRVILGDRVKVVGFGVDAGVSGELRVVEGKQGEASRGTGEIRLAGTYEAFGRKLNIERGKLLFAGTALDDPQLDILATRKLQDVTAKLAVTGTAQHPKLDVFTDPAMSQADAMAYLITGKPASDVHGQDGQVVQSATQNVGILLGNRLAKKLGGKVGIVDSVGVEQNADLGGSAFTVGKYLSPKLFVSYGVGLFEPGSAVTVRYEFSERWSLEANDTPEDQHAGVRYRIEK